MGEFPCRDGLVLLVHGLHDVPVRVDVEQPLPAPAGQGGHLRGKVSHAYPAAQGRFDARRGNGRQGLPGSDCQDRMDPEPSRLLFSGQLQHGARVPVEQGRLEVVELRHEFRERPEHGKHADPAGHSGVASPRGFGQHDAGKVVPVRDQRPGAQPPAEQSPGLRRRHQHPPFADPDEEVRDLQRVPVMDQDRGFPGGPRRRHDNVLPTVVAADARGIAEEVCFQTGERNVGVGHPVIEAFHEFALAHRRQLPQIRDRVRDVPVQPAVEGRGGPGIVNEHGEPVALPAGDRVLTWPSRTARCPTRSRSSASSQEESRASPSPFHGARS